MSEYLEPHPELRCRHVWRSKFGLGAFGIDVWPDPFYDRCAGMATQEDGLCDHCRPGGCTADDGPEPYHGRLCCSSPEGIGYLLSDDNLTEPCFDRAQFQASKEFAAISAGPQNDPLNISDELTPIHLKADEKIAGHPVEKYVE